MTVLSRQLRRATTLVALTAAISLTAVACGSDSSSNSTGASDSNASSNDSGAASSGGDITLRVNTLPVNISLLEDNGFLDDLDYEIEWSTLYGGGPHVQALTGNKVDVIWPMGTGSTVLAASEAKEAWTSDNAPWKLVSLLSPAYSGGGAGTIVVTNAQSGITELADLEGKKLAYPEGSGNLKAVAYLVLDNLGVTADDIELVNLPIDSLANAVLANQVDAVVITKPQIAAGLSDGSVVQLTDEAELGGRSAVSVAVSTSALDDDAVSAAVGDLLGRFIAFNEWSKDNDTVVADAYVKADQLTQEQAIATARSLVWNFEPVRSSDPQFVIEQDLADLIAGLGGFTSEVDFSAFTDDRFTDIIEAGTAG